MGITAVLSGPLAVWPQWGPSVIEAEQRGRHITAGLANIPNRRTKTAGSPLKHTQYSHWESSDFQALPGIQSCL